MSFDKPNQRYFLFLYQILMTVDICLLRHDFFSVKERYTINYARQK